MFKNLFQEIQDIQGRNKLKRKVDFITHYLNLRYIYIYLHYIRYLFFRDVTFIQYTSLFAVKIFRCISSQFAMFCLCRIFLPEGKIIESKGSWKIDGFYAATRLSYTCTYARVYMYTDTCNTYTYIHAYIPRLPTRTHIFAPSFAFSMHVIADLRSHECFKHALFSSCHRRKSFQKFTHVNAVMYYSYFHCECRSCRNLGKISREKVCIVPRRRVESSLYRGCCFIVSFTFMELSISYNAACVLTFHKLIW